MAPPTDRLKQPGPQSGFNLIAMSIMLTVAALIMVSFIQGKEAGDYNAKAMTNVQKLDKVEEAMKAYMAKNGHRPCPADGLYPVGSANFGVEAATSGTCSGGTPAADFFGTSYIPTGDTTSGSTVIINISSTSGLNPGLSISGSGIATNAYIASVDSSSQVTLSAAATATASGVSLTFTNQVVGGVIPTKTLGLDDSYALDEWGRRFTYVVDMRATAANSCQTLQGITLTSAGTNMGSGKGGVAIESATGVQPVIDNTMVAYISHGTDGHGAFPAQGSTVANRINTGSTDTDKLTNAGVDSSFTYNTTNFTNVKIRKEKTFTFDDTVYYAEATKNTCCVGPVCTPLGFRIGDPLSAPHIDLMAVGDFNGDGIDDLVLSSWGEFYVIFGTKEGFPSPFLVSQLNGTNGFAFPSGGEIAMGDFNGDGYQDIAVFNSTGNGIIIFGGPGPWPATTTEAALITAGKAVSINLPTNMGNPWGGNLWGGIGLFGADVNGDNIDDLIGGFTTIGVPGAISQVDVLFGHTGAWSSTTYANSDLNGTTGVVYLGDSGGGDWFGDSIAAADVNGDGVKDIIIGDGNGQQWGPPDGTVYTIFGMRSGWPKVPTTASTLMDGHSGFTFYDGAQAFGESLAVGDFNGDGYADIVSTASWGGDAGILFGKHCGNPWGNACDTNVADWLLNGTNGVYLGISGWTGETCSKGGLSAADVNNDGISDLIIGMPGDNNCELNNARGAVGVIFGHTGAWPVSISTNPGSPIYNGVTGVEIDGTTAENGELGFDIGAGDINGDGIKDIIASAPSSALSGGGYPYQNGSVYVIYGHKAGRWPTAPIDVTGW